jgi:hypothetical protein
MLGTGQTPYSQLFPAIPQGFETPFWYASLQSFWTYWYVEPNALREHVAAQPGGDQMEPALFDFGPGLGQGGMVSLDFQRYTGHGPAYLEYVHEVEFNIYIYPASRVPEVPALGFDQYLLGWDQTKTIGGYRLHVPCDNQNAINAGKAFYGEPKFLAAFSYALPTLNAAPTQTWQYSTLVAEGGASVYELTADFAGLQSQPGNPSPLVEYGTLNGQLVGNQWSFYGPFDTWLFAGAAPNPVTLSLGAAPDPGTYPDAAATYTDLRKLIGSNPAVAAQAFTSAPVSSESRGWYTVPLAQ